MTGSTWRPRSPRRSVCQSSQRLSGSIPRGPSSDQALASVRPLVVARRSPLGRADIPRSPRRPRPRHGRADACSCASRARTHRATTGVDTTDVVDLDPLSAADVETSSNTCRSDRSRRPGHSSRYRRGTPLFAEQLLITLDDGPIEDFPMSLTRATRHAARSPRPGESDLLDARRSSGSSSSSMLCRTPSPDAHPFSKRHLQFIGADALHRSARARPPAGSALPGPHGGVSEHSRMRIVPRCTSASRMEPVASRPTLLDGGRLPP